MLLPAGAVPPNPAELLSSAPARDIFTRLRDHFDLVLIEALPADPRDAPIELERLTAACHSAAAVSVARGRSVPPPGSVLPPIERS